MQPKPKLRVLFINEILSVVERTSRSLKTSDKDVKAAEKDESLITMDDFIEEQVIEELKAIDLNAISPYEAMSLLYNLQKRLK